MDCNCGHPLEDYHKFELYRASIVLMCVVCTGVVYRVNKKPCMIRTGVE